MRKSGGESGWLSVNPHPGLERQSWVQLGIWSPSGGVTAGDSHWSQLLRSIADAVKEDAGAAKERGGRRQRRSRAEQ
jgi:hypothetical protein